MDGIEATDNFDTTRLGEADFWFSPFVLPQYDLLVAQGHITQDEADCYRRERKEAGLAMNPQDLPMRPARAFEWLWEAGGPSVASDSSRVDIGGIEFIAYAWQHSEHGELNCHPSIPKPDDYLGWKLKKPRAETGVAWEAACKLREGVYARTSGTEPTLVEAVATVSQQTFQPESLGGLAWYPNENGWLAIGPEQMETTVAPHWDHENRSNLFVWNVALPEGTPLRQLADLMQSFGKAFHGEADSREAAIAAALGAPNRARILAAQIVGDQAFEAGRQAGRRELKSEIFAL